MQKQLWNLLIASWLKQKRSPCEWLSLAQIWKKVVRDNIDLSNFFPSLVKLVPIISCLLFENLAKFLNSFLRFWERCMLPLPSVTYPPPACEQYIQVFSLLPNDLKIAEIKVTMSTSTRNNLQARKRKNKKKSNYQWEKLSYLYITFIQTIFYKLTYS